MPRFNDKDTIIEHYDLVSPYYHSLWGEHLHHGYHLKAFQAMRAGFASGNFVYGLFVARAAS